MGYFEIGHWAVTTTADAYGDGNDENIDPAKADPEHMVWCVYDVRYDDEPIAAGMTNPNARTVATALNLLDSAMSIVVPFSQLPELAGACQCGHASGDHTIQHGCIFSESMVDGVCDCESFRPTISAYKPRRDPYDEVKAKGYYVACCRACDDGTPMPIPFSTIEARSDWMNEHTKGAGHYRYVAVDPIPIQGEPLPFGFAQAGEVSLGSIAAGPSVSGVAGPKMLRGPARLQMVDRDGRPFGPSIEIADAEVVTE